MLIIMNNTEIPKNCRQCELVKSELNNFEIPCNFWCPVTGNDVDCNARASDCPIISLPDNATLGDMLIAIYGGKVTDIKDRKVYAEWLKELKHLKESAITLEQIKETRKEIDKIYGDSLTISVQALENYASHVDKILDKLMEGGEK